MLIIGSLTLRNCEVEDVWTRAILEWVAPWKSFRQRVSGEKHDGNIVVVGDSSPSNLIHTDTGVWGDMYGIVLLEIWSLIIYERLLLMPVSSEGLNLVGIFFDEV